VAKCPLPDQKARAGCECETPCQAMGRADCIAASMGTIAVWRSRNILIWLDIWGRARAGDGAGA
jgi:hypothetical protein